jgi:hypothetical protein
MRQRKVLQYPRERKPLHPQRKNISGNHHLYLYPGKASLPLSYKRVLTS